MHSCSSGQANLMENTCMQRGVVNASLLHVHTFQAYPQMPFWVNVHTFKHEKNKEIRFLPNVSQIFYMMIKFLSLSLLFLLRVRCSNSPIMNADSDTMLFCVRGWWVTEMKFTLMEEKVAKIVIWKFIIYVFILSKPQFQ